MSTTAQAHAVTAQPASTTAALPVRTVHRDGTVALTDTATTAHTKALGTVHVNITPTVPTKTEGDNIVTMATAQRIR